MERTYAASLVMTGDGGRVTVESGPHPSAAEAMAALAEMVRRLWPNAPVRDGPSLRLG